MSKETENLLRIGTAVGRWSGLGPYNVSQRVCI
jgi:hypothetical protein